LRVSGKKGQLIDLNIFTKHTTNKTTWSIFTFSNCHFAISKSWVYKKSCFKCQNNIGYA